ncbi:DUF1284 domain-containing protein [Ostreiculturibacter nitratireducens]|uniref:DUF1284 domain-containing protein n=1 Tax=Ostreiculturibacter nitratireducens TaxID=3075226 RepID=UPI0031B5D560
MTRGALRFRPHHFLCALGFEGKGYSEEFTANMTEIVMDRLRRPEGGAEVIEVTCEADDICIPCPSRRGVGCESTARITTLDKAHAGALGLSAGDRLSWGEALDRIRENVPPGSLSTLCAECQWLPLGLCEAALARLHAEYG